jgi:hypothetical protein
MNEKHVEKPPLQTVIAYAWDLRKDVDRAIDHLDEELAKLIRIRIWLDKRFGGSPLPVMQRIKEKQ